MDESENLQRDPVRALARTATQSLEKPEILDVSPEEVPDLID